MSQEIEQQKSGESDNTEPLPHGEDIKEFGAPHDYAYKPSPDELAAPEYVAFSDETPESDDEPSQT